MWEGSVYSQALEPLFTYARQFREEQAQTMGGNVAQQLEGGVNATVDLHSRCGAAIPQTYPQAWAQRTVIKMGNGTGVPTPIKQTCTSLNSGLRMAPFQQARVHNHQAHTTNIRETIKRSSGQHRNCNLTVLLIRRPLRYTPLQGVVSKEDCRRT